MKDYHHFCAVEYTPESEDRGWALIPVLQFLTGKPWDEVALAYVHALRPTSIRVVGDSEQSCDARTWRVTVYVDNKDIIENIEQEIEVWLPHKVAHGAALNEALKHGIDSKECQWYQDCTGTVDDGIHGKYYKITKAGYTVLFPGHAQ